MSAWSWTKVWEERDEEEWQELGFHWLTLENTLLISRDWGHVAEEGEMLFQ